MSVSMQIESVQKSVKMQTESIGNIRKKIDHIKREYKKELAVTKQHQ